MLLAEIMAIIAFAGLVFFIGTLVFWRKASVLQSQLAQAKQLQSKVDKLQDELQQQLLNNQNLRVAESKLQAQLDAAKTYEHQLRQQSKQHLDDIKQKLEETQKKEEALQAQLHDMSQKHIKLHTELEERQASHARELANFEKQKESLSEQFKLLSNEILESKSKALQENSKASLSALMAPFQQSIDSFKKEVQDIHHRDTQQQSQLRQELVQLKELNLKITEEAHQLSTALRGQKKLQGNWGELILENVLERSGLQLGTDYQREVSFSTVEGRQRPDAIVYLPDNKHLIIDAKVSLNAYTRYVNSDCEAERAQALKEHVQAVAGRIKELADKDYYRLPGLNSPEIVFMFIPIESAFVEALKADDNLFTQAIERNVLVATPTTLLTSLNIVRQLWRYEAQNKHTELLASKAEAVFNKLNTFLASFESIKKNLEKATEAYVKAEGQLLSGRGNLVKQVGDFKSLAPSIKAELPRYFSEKAELEMDFTGIEQAESEAIEDNKS